MSPRSWSISAPSFWWQQQRGQIMSTTIYHLWLVVYLPLWKIGKSIGMMTFPRYGKIKVMFQTTNQDVTTFHLPLVCFFWSVFHGVFQAPSRQQSQVGPSYCYTKRCDSPWGSLPSAVSSDEDIRDLMATDMSNKIQQDKIRTSKVETRLEPPSSKQEWNI